MAKTPDSVTELLEWVRDKAAGEEFVQLFAQQTQKDKTKHDGATPLLIVKNRCIL